MHRIRKGQFDLVKLGFEDATTPAVQNAAAPKSPDATSGSLERITNKVPEFQRRRLCYYARKTRRMPAIAAQ
jgi:hypothetical protein